MSELHAELMAIEEDIRDMKRMLAEIEHEANLDGYVDPQEAAEIQEMHDVIREALDERHALEREIAEAEARSAEAVGDDEDDGGLFGAIGDFIEEAVDAVSSPSSETTGTPEPAPVTANDGPRETDRDGGLLSSVGNFVEDAVETVASAAQSVTDAVSDAVTGDQEGSGEPSVEMGQGIKSSLSGSVGNRGNNAGDDVVTVQLLLNRSGCGLVPDGDCGPKTIAAIRKFQEDNLGFNDGRVDPGGQSWRALNGGGAPAEGVLEEAGSWLQDAASSVADTVGEMAEAAADFLTGDDEVDEEEIQRIHDELVALEQEAESL